MKPLIRVTQLEAFRRYLYDAYGYITEQSVIDNITKEFKGNSYTRIGTAFHSVVETGEPETVKVDSGERHFMYYGKDKSEPVPCGRKFSIDGTDVVLDISQCRTALEYRGRFPGALHEVREYKEYPEAVVTGCADLIYGASIRDIKTKFSSPSDADYIDSAQWRFYLELFECDVFHFDLFIFDGYNLEKHGDDARGLPLIKHEPSIDCYRYDGMESDNRRLLLQFLDFCETKDLIKYLHSQIKTE